MIYSKEKKVVILSEQPLFIFGLKCIISHNKDFMVVDHCSTSSELLLLLSVNTADVVIVDTAAFSGKDDLTALIDELYSSHRDTVIAAFSESREHLKLHKSYEPKVQCHMCKTDSPAKIIDELRMTIRLKKISVHSGSINNRAALNFNSTGHLVSQKEKVVLEHLCSGLTVSQTAMRVNRSIKTISSQKRSAMRKLGITKERDLFFIDFSIL